MLRTLARIAGIEISEDRLALPEPLYFWGAREGPVVIEAPEFPLLPLFSSPETGQDFYNTSLSSVTEEGGPEDGARKEFRLGTLETVLDLRMLFEMVAKDERRCRMCAVDPPPRGVPFKAADTVALLRVAERKARVR